MFMSEHVNIGSLTCSLKWCIPSLKPQIMPPWGISCRYCPRDGILAGRKILMGGLLDAYQSELALHMDASPVPHLRFALKAMI